MSREFIVYGHNQCPFCVKAKDLLTSKNETYTERNVRENDEYRDYLVNGLKQRTVPQVVVVEDGVETYIGGFEKLESYFDEEDLF